MRSVLCFSCIILQILAAVCLSEDDNGPAESIESIQDLTEVVETTEKTDNTEVGGEFDEQTTENARENDTEEVSKEIDGETETASDSNVAANRTFTWPVCTAEGGCKPHLNCSNLTEIADERLSTIVNDQKVVPVTQEELSEVLSNKTLPCACLLVMFYARWCQHSIQFVPTYNILGHTLPHLPVLAFDFGANYS